MILNKPLNLTISIDDINPLKGWGAEGDIQMTYLDDLNREFGAKFTLFIPSNWHKQAPLSKHKDWIDWLKSKDYFELAAHGHYHECENTGIGECEFWELNTEQKAKDRINLMFKEWEAIGHKPEGWRNPGWLGNPIAIKELGKHFKYSAVHYEHNLNNKWLCKTFYGADGIDTTDIKIHNNNMIMFQSHIAGDWNDNIWNKTNYEQMRVSLKHLSKMNVEYKTLSECL
jgi:hypothetical protein|tara:strand:+ start:1801 stop:2484 length:684 start_codon:yes stop_codon:yes gene_type:complete